MSITRFKTVGKTKKDHECYGCNITIPRGSLCTYSVTTDPDHLTRFNQKILSVYFCSTCRPIELNY